MVKTAARNYDPTRLERTVRRYWDETKAYEKTKAQRSAGEDFYFIDGPPYTSGNIHLGTAWNKTLKDAGLRYLRMKGYNIRDQSGFDMHGLPIEVRVEKELGIKNKNEIREYGVDKFIARCRDFAMVFQKRMAQQFKDLGVWLDWENPYLTIRNSYIESAWWTIKRANDRGLLTRSERVLSWCPRCQTALAEAEVEYWDEVDPSIYVKFQLESPRNPDEKEYIVIWTTTPWTLLANLCVAVHPDFTYVRARVTDADGGTEILLLLEERAEEVAKLGRYRKIEILEKLRGADLEGVHYLHPFEGIVPFHSRDNLEKYPSLHMVVLADYVEADRTGCVHTAPGHGPEDFETGREYGLPPFCPVDEAGVYTDEAGTRFRGKFTKDADAEIMEYLADGGWLLDRGTLEHRYGHCWRCKRPITHRTTSQWFLKVTRIQDRMLEELARIQWYPEWAGSQRFRSWVENTRDWCISRQRYWGIPLPVWLCENPACAALRVVGSAKELEDAEGMKGYEPGMDLHRPWIDGVEFSCGKCGATMRRVEDVLDVWLDSAVCSWAQLGYPHDPGSGKEFERWWPCRWITEAHDQTRGWFYSQLGASVIAFDRIPYESVLMHGFTQDAEGRKMSKSLGNNVEPSEVEEKYGVDSLRYYFMKSSAPWEDLPFSWESVKAANRTLNILWNVHKFATTYMALDGFDPGAVGYGDVKEALRLEDRWLLSRIESLVKEFTGYWETYEWHKASRALDRFILEDLSRWYVRLVKSRTWQEENSRSDDHSNAKRSTGQESDNPDKKAAYFTLHRALNTVAIIMSPLTPHICERIYRDLDGELPSVAMNDWPEPDESLIDTELEKQVSVLRQVTETVLSLRHASNLKLRWPVTGITIETDETDVSDAVDALRDVLLDRINAKAVEITGRYENTVLTAAPVKGKIGPVFKGNAGRVMALIQNTPADELRAGLESGELELDGIPVTGEMVEFSSELPENIVSGEFPGGVVYLDTTITEALRAEGMAREIIRRIQEMRKEMDLHVEAKIMTWVDCPEIAGQITEWRDLIARETRSEDLELVDFVTKEGMHEKTWEVEGKSVRIGIVEKK